MRETTLRQIEDTIHKVRDAARAARAAEIDAACCQTRRDYQKMEEKQSAECDTIEQAINTLTALVKAGE
jgi:hypothetical protein